MKTAIYSMLLLLTFLGAQAQSHQVNVRYSTFNIRYDNPEDGRNNWQYRKDSVAGYITHHAIDIVGMQEVLHNQAEYLKKTLTDYARVGVGREDGHTQGEYAPIFYRTDRFDLLDSNTFWLSQYPDSVGFVGWDGACTRIATWAKLREKKSGRIFMAINTHFDHVGVEARRNAALLIIDRIRQIVGDNPAIVSGDFNVNDRSEAYRTLTTNAYLLRDAHKEAAVTQGPAYTFHDFGREKAELREKIDFIFVSKNIQVTRSEIAPTPNNVNGFFISDHNPQISDLTF